MIQAITRHLKRLDAKREKVKDSIKHNLFLSVSFKVAVLTIGSVIVIAGIAMLVLPGPGLLAIFAGLAVLATELPWVHRLVRLIKLQVKRLIRTWKRYRRNHR